MELYRMRQIDFRHEDERGSLTQLIHGGYRQVNVLSSREGAVRGAHFHRRATEAFYLIDGSVEAAFKGRDGAETVTFRRGDFFEVPPFVLHTMRFPEDCLMVQMYDVPVENEDGTKDTFPEEEFHA